MSQNRIYNILRQRRKEKVRRRKEAFEKVQGSSDATTPWLRSKLMVVGKGAAGKSNTVRSLLGLQLNPEWDSTVGIDLTEVATKPGTRWTKTQLKDFCHKFCTSPSCGNFRRITQARG